MNNEKLIVEEKGREWERENWIKKIALLFFNNLNFWKDILIYEVILNINSEIIHELITDNCNLPLE